MPSSKRVEASKQITKKLQLKCSDQVTLKSSILSNVLIIILDFSIIRVYSVNWNSSLMRKLKHLFS